MDVIIKDVPVGAENTVKAMAMIAIERFLKDRDVKADKAIQDKFETDVDAIRVANDRTAKFTPVEIEEIIAREG